MRSPNQMWKIAAVCLAVGATGRHAAAQDLENVVLYLNWTPQVEDAGFYQAVQTGIYKKYGLNVTIRPGGPQMNTTLFLLSKQADFIDLHSSGELIGALEQSLPLVAVAALYQKDPEIVVAHKGVGHDSLQSLKGAPIMLSQDARSSFWPWLKLKFGYTDDQIRPYAFQLAPFLTDKNAVQQAYLTAEPFAMKKAAVDPNIFLLSDFGWKAYASIIVARTDENPDRVRRFVRASIEGWYSYWNDPASAHEALRKVSPDQTDAQMDFSRSELARNGILLSGDALSHGIGAMTDERWKQFYDEMSDAGLYKKGLDYKKVYSLAYVNDASFIDDLKKQYPNAVAAATVGSR
jgi:NitT/TauT family transport system substrate-binding protein